MRAGDAVSTRNGMWEILKDSKCFELILLLRHLEFSMRNALLQKQLVFTIR